MTREQWRAYSLDHLDEDPRIVEFLSLQDLKGSQYFGGSLRQAQAHRSTSTGTCS